MKYTYSKHRYDGRLYIYYIQCYRENKKGSIISAKFKPDIKGRGVGLRFGPLKSIKGGFVFEHAPFE